MRQIYFLTGLTLGIGLTVFALQNTGGVEVRFLFWQSRGPLAAVVFFSALGGLLVALLFGLPGLLSARWRIRSLERRLEGQGPPPTGPPDRPS